MTSALGTFHSKGYVITIAFFFECELYWAWNRQREPGEKPPNPMKKTEKKNRKTTENILAP